VPRCRPGAGSISVRVMATWDLQWILNAVSGFIDTAMRFWPATVCLVLATCDLQWILFAASGSTVPVGRLWNARSWVRLSCPFVFALLFLRRVHGTLCFIMDSNMLLSGRSRRIEKYNGFWTAAQNRLSICDDYVATQFGRPRSIDKTQWFLNVEAESLQYTTRSWLPAFRVASSKWEKWLLAFFWSMLVLTLHESRSIENTMDSALRFRIHNVLQVAVTASRRPAKHNGFWRGGQNPLCFSMDRERAVFPHRFWCSSQLFVV